MALSSEELVKLIQSSGIVVKNISDLIKYAKNAKAHPEFQVNQIATSIKEYGFVNPILIDEKGEIIAGHGRVLACEKLGLKEVSCIVLTHLDEGRKRAYRIADNKLNMNTSWLDDFLKVELTELDESGIDIGLTGFSEMEWINLFKIDEGTNDPLSYDGMPEFDQQDKTAFRSIIVHFKEQGDVDLFSKTIAKKITPKTKYIWFPEIEIDIASDKVYE